MTIERGWGDDCEPEPIATEEMIAEKNCPRCHIELVMGIVTSPYMKKNTFYDPSNPVATAENLRLVKCWKCPSCGHSEEYLVYPTE